MRDQRPAVARCLPRELVPTGDAHVRGPALQVSAHQSGRLITTECSHRWPARLWPAGIGAPRRSRTYNPLAGSRVISRALRETSVLVSGGVQGSRSCPMVSRDASNSNISVDQTGRSIMSPGLLTPPRCTDRPVWASPMWGYRDLPPFRVGGPEPAEEPGSREQTSWWWGRRRSVREEIR